MDNLLASFGQTWSCLIFIKKGGLNGFWEWQKNVARELNQFVWWAYMTSASKKFLDEFVVVMVSENPGNQYAEDILWDLHRNQAILNSNCLIHEKRQYVLEKTDTRKRTTKSITNDLWHLCIWLQLQQHTQTHVFYIYIFSNNQIEKKKLIYYLR